MLRKPNITSRKQFKNDHRSRRILKKYTRYLTRKDRDFRGSKVYTFILNGETYFTARPKQKGSKEQPLRWVNWYREVKLWMNEINI